MLIEIDFDDGNMPWLIQNKLRCKQVDGHNCGPIACVIIMEIYGWLREGAVNKIANNKGGYRQVVTRYFSHVIDKYDNVLRAELRTNVYSDGRKGYEDRVGDLVKATADSNANNTEGEMVKTSNHLQPTIVDSSKDTEANKNTDDIITNEEIITTKENRDNEDVATRELAMEKKNKKQESEAKKAMKKCGKAAEDAGARVGAVVSLHVDYRTHSHARGLIAVVYACKPMTGGILVCCEHGIITHSGTKADYWVPADKYRVVARPDELIPIPDELAAVRALVLAMTYNPIPQKRISYSKLHDLIVSSTSPVKRNKGCSCKKGCKKGCGCKKNGFACHSGCACNGSCGGDI